MTNSHIEKVPINDSGDPERIVVPAAVLDSEIATYRVIIATGPPAPWLRRSAISGDAKECAPLEPLRIECRPGYPFRPGDELFYAETESGEGELDLTLECFR